MADDVATTAEALQSTPLWQHMTQVLATVLRERPADALSAMGSTSTLLRTGDTLPPHTRSAYACTRPTAVSQTTPSSAAAASAMTSVAWAARVNEAMTAVQHPAHADARAALAGGEVDGDMGDGEDDDDDDDVMYGGEDGTGAAAAVITALGGRDEEQAMMNEAAAVAAEVPAGVLEDVVAVQRTFNEVGAGLSPTAALQVCIGLRTLLRTAPLSRVRLWGRIRCTQHDYLVAEGTTDATRLAELREAAEAAAAAAGGGGDGDVAAAGVRNDEDDDEAALRADDDMDGGGGGADEDEDEDGDGDGHRRVAAVAAVLSSHRAGVRPRHTPREPHGSGANAYAYYVAHVDSPTRWTRLPEVQPRHIVAARRIHRPLTGELNAPVCSHPRFPGREKHYLRAQIARIHCACTLAPRGMYTTEGAVPDMGNDDDEDNGGGEDGGGRRSRAPPTVVRAYASELPLHPRDAASVGDDDDDDADDNNKDAGDGVGADDGNGDGAARRAWRRGYGGDALLQSRYWVHTAPTLLSCGRVTTPPTPPPIADDGDASGEEDNNNNTMTRRRSSTTHTSGGGSGSAAAVAAEGVAADGVEYIHPFLCDVGCDAALSFAGHSRARFDAWCFRKAYQHESCTRRVYVARSLRWPGALVSAATVAGKPGAQCALLYVGNGLKSLDGGSGDGGILSPQLPPARMCEYDEEALVLQRDCTAEEERAYAPPPSRGRDGDDDDENGEHGDEDDTGRDEDDA